ncbi:unnamed protein product, partial [Musa acuminata subsp. burmannicoides]
MQHEPTLGPWIFKLDIFIRMNKRGRGIADPKATRIPRNRIAQKTWMIWMS